MTRHFTLLSGLLGLILSGSGCTQVASSSAPTDSTLTPPESSPQSQSAMLPTMLLGIWFRDDAEGRTKCDRYRSLPESIEKSDEAWISMIGSIVITPRLIHEYAEYGEGNFYSVRDVESLSDRSWQVEASGGIDSMPDEDIPAELETHQLELEQGRLRLDMHQSRADHTSTYFRCGSVRNDLYQTE